MSKPSHIAYTINGDAALYFDARPSSSYPTAACDIHTMLRFLEPGGIHRIRFQVGKLGRVDRFALTVANRGMCQKEIMHLATQPEEETAGVLKILDDLLDTDPEFGVLYNNPRNPEFAYCLWCKPIDISGQCANWAKLTKVLPPYRRRMREQRRICDGTLKRGHRDFGFFPLDGYR